MKKIFAKNLAIRIVFLFVFALVSCRGRSLGSGGPSPLAGGGNVQNYFIFTANNGSADISVFTANSSEGFLTSLGNVPATIAPCVVATDPSSRFLYVGDAVTQTTAVFAIDRNAGTIAAKPNTASVQNPLSMAFNPNGKFMYAPNVAGGSIVPFAIDPISGGLSAGLPILTASPSSTVVSPDGKFLLDGSVNSSSLYVFSVDANTGDLTNLGGYGNSEAPDYILFNTAGTHVYAVNTRNQSRIITEYTFSNGALIAASPTNTLNNIQAVAIDPLDRFFFQTDTSTNTIYTFSIGSGGTLSYRSQFTAATGAHQFYKMAVEPSGHFLYMVGLTARTILTFAIDQNTGSLSSVGNAAPTGAFPQSILIVPRN